MKTTSYIDRSGWCERRRQERRSKKKTILKSIILIIAGAVIVFGAGLVSARLPETTVAASSLGPETISQKITAGYLSASSTDQMPLGR